MTEGALLPPPKSLLAARAFSGNTRDWLYFYPLWVAAYI